MKRFLIGVLAFITACTSPLEPADKGNQRVTYPSTPMAVGVGTHGSFEEARILETLGVKHTRITYSYRTGSLPHLADRMQDLRNHHVEPLIVVHDFFPYATMPNFCPLVQTVRGSQWQVGNEWDAQRYTGQQYATLMRHVVPTIKACDPTAKIIGMGLAVTDGRPWAYMADAVRVPSFLEAYLQASGPLLDAWSIHTYGWPLDQATEARVVATRAVLRDLMPLWITETGMDRENFEKAVGQMPYMDRSSIFPMFRFKPWDLYLIDQYQTVALLGMLEKAKALGIQRVYIYQLWDNTRDGFGLLEADARTPRVSYYVLQDYLRN